MKDPLGVSPSKGNQGTTRGTEKILLTSKILIKRYQEAFLLDEYGKMKGRQPSENLNIRKKIKTNISINNQTKP